MQIWNMTKVFQGFTKMIYNMVFQSEQHPLTVILRNAEVGNQSFLEFSSVRLSRNPNFLPALVRSM